MALARHDALSLLHQMQLVSRRSAPGLPEQEQAAPRWTGLGFRLADLQYVTPLSHVSEVLPPPAITPVPGARRWVKGIANVRGNLYTVIDLPEFFGKEPVQSGDNTRLLIVNIPDLNSALLVNQVLGLRHFDEEKERQDISGFSDPSLAHTRGAFLQDNVMWAEFDMHSLAESQEFRHVAA